MSGKNSRVSEGYTAKSPSMTAHTQVIEHEEILHCC